MEEGYKARYTLVKSSYNAFGDDPNDKKYAHVQEFL
jgi:hypothetical protein